MSKVGALFLLPISCFFPPHEIQDGIHRGSWVIFLHCTGLLNFITIFIYLNVCFLACLLVVFTTLLFLIHRVAPKLLTVSKKRKKPIWNRKYNKIQMHHFPLKQQPIFKRPLKELHLHLEVKSHQWWSPADFKGEGVPQKRGRHCEGSPSGAHQLHFPPKWHSQESLSGGAQCMERLMTDVILLHEVPFYKMLLHKEPLSCL